MFKHLGFNLSPQAKKRLLTSAALITGLVIAFCLRLITVWIFDIFIFLMVIMAAIDILGAKKLSERGVKNYYVYAYLLIAYFAFMFITIFNSSYAVWLHLGIQALLLGIFALYIFIMNYTDKAFVKQAVLKKQTPGRACGRTAWEFIKVAFYPALMLFMLVPLNHLDLWATVAMTEGAEPVTVGVAGLFSLLLVFMISCFTDTFAYCTGSFFRKRFPNTKKLCPKISPNKTWAGAIGGLFGGILGSMLLVLIFSANAEFARFLTDRIGYSLAVQLTFCAIGLVGSVVSQAGDIFASWLKRRSGVKDFGRYLPGHGGAMDRLDGISFNAVFVLAVMMIITFAL